VQSLAPVDPVPYATVQITTALGYRLPKMRYSQYVAQLWRRVDALLASDPTTRTSLRKVLLQNAPATDVPKWLDQFYRADMDDKNCVPALEQLGRECHLSDDVLTKFRPGAVHCFLRTWRVIGPFPNAAEVGHNTVYPVEQEPVALSAQYSGAGGKVPWRLVTSERDKVDLASVFTGDQLGVAYAVCWVESPQQKAALLEIGSNDGFKVWVNRKLVLDDEFRRRAEPGQNSARADLTSGWNEVLVKLDNRFGPCCFFLELYDTATGNPWKGLKVRTDPPPGA
jgi:hypothetical protein